MCGICNVDNIPLQSSAEPRFLSSSTPRTKFNYLSLKYASPSKSIYKFDFLHIIKNVLNAQLNLIFKYFSFSEC